MKGEFIFNAGISDGEGDNAYFWTDGPAKVSVIRATPLPMEAISFAAGVCYGKRDSSPKRAVHCLNSGHMGVFEHAHVTFLVEGISRSCSHQLVRHRLCSFCQESQRYAKVDVDSGDAWYVVPESVARDWKALEEFEAAMWNAGKAYSNLISHGMKPEDARYVLPEATKTSLVVTMNYRELLHILSLRDSQAAQWEIRRLARLMKLALSEHSEEWRELILRSTD